MNPVDIQDEGLGPGQARVLRELTAADEPLTLARLHEGTGLHVNTLRGHLHALLAAGRVTRLSVRSGGRGRPAWAYVARESEYAALSMALAGALAGAQADDGSGAAGDEAGGGPGEAARHGGRAWGQRLVERLGAPDQDSRHRLVLALEHTGFQPEADADTIRLRHCPLLDAARQHPDVVCAVHLGLIEGVLGEGGAELVPFAEPGACLVRLP
jgi:predicted ArsR family transcriptional regulator